MTAPEFSHSLRYWLVMALTTIGGFSISLLGFIGWAYVKLGGKEFQGQLIAGDPTVNREFPTTLNTIGDAVGGGNPIVSAMSSYAWWLGVLIGGIVASWLLLKFTRRFIG